MEFECVPVVAPGGLLTPGNDIPTRGVCTGATTSGTPPAATTASISSLRVSTIFIAIDDDGFRALPNICGASPTGGVSPPSWPDFANWLRVGAGGSSVGLLLGVTALAVAAANALIALLLLLRVLTEGTVPFFLPAACRPPLDEPN